MPEKGHDAIPQNSAENDSIVYIPLAAMLAGQCSLLAIMQRQHADRFFERARLPMVCWVATETIRAEMKLGTL